MERTEGAGDAGDARQGGEGQGGARPLSSLAFPAAPQGALAHDPLGWRLRLARSPPCGQRGWRAAGLAERRWRVHCGAAAGRALGCGGRRRRRRQSCYARLVRRPHPCAAQCAPAPRNQAGGGRWGRGNTRRRGVGGGGEPEETRGAKGRRGIEMGAGEGRPRDGTERERTRRGLGGQSGGWSAAFLGEVLSSDPSPSHLAAAGREGAGTC